MVSQRHADYVTDPGGIDYIDYFILGFLLQAVAVNGLNHLQNHPLLSQYQGDNPVTGGRGRSIAKIYILQGQAQVLIFQGCYHALQVIPFLAGHPDLVTLNT